MNKADLDALVSQTMIAKGQYTELRARANAVRGNILDVDRRVNVACEAATRERDFGSLDTLLELRSWMGEALKILNRLGLGMEPRRRG